MLFKSCLFASSIFVRVWVCVFSLRHNTNKNWNIFGNSDGFFCFSLILIFFFLFFFWRSFVLFLFTYDLANKNKRNEEYCWNFMFSLCVFCQSLFFFGKFLLLVNGRRKKMKIRSFNCLLASLMGFQIFVLTYPSSSMSLDGWKIYFVLVVLSFLLVVALLQLRTPCVYTQCNCMDVARNQFHIWIPRAHNDNDDVSVCLYIVFTLSVINSDTTQIRHFTRWLCFFFVVWFAPFYCVYDFLA